MIDAAKALEIARARAAANGWAFPEPFEILPRRGWLGQHDRFDIETNSGNRGTKARFTVDAVTGELLSEGYIPR
jgi:hypothetical protein